MAGCWPIRASSASCSEPRLPPPQVPCYHAARMRHLPIDVSRAVRAPRGSDFAFFGGWYIADGAKEAAPA